MIQLSTPLQDTTLLDLKMGDSVALCGVVYTARDSAHKRMIETLNNGEPLPVQLKDQVIFYAGPAPAPPGKAIGAVGPTTSTRMDAFTPALLELGLKGMIGKGCRSEKVRESIQKYQAVYFGAVGGAAALLSQKVVAAEIVAYPDLGPEAIWKFEMKNFPLIVLVDSQGNDLYQRNSREVVSRFRNGMMK